MPLLESYYLLNIKIPTLIDIFGHFDYYSHCYPVTAFNGKGTFTQDDRKISDLQKYFVGTTFKQIHQ